MKWLKVAVNVIIVTDKVNMILHKAADLLKSIYLTVKQEEANGDDDDQERDSRDD